MENQTSTSASARLAFETCLTVAKEHIAEREYPAARLALERAQALGQERLWLRLRVHWWMLRCGLAERELSFG